MKHIRRWLARGTPTDPILHRGHPAAEPPLDSDRIISALYRPLPAAPEPGQTRLSWSRDPVRGRPADGRLPVPPPELRMGYAADSEEKYLAWGERTASLLRGAFGRYRVGEAGSAPILEWGCASGRVLRHFAREAEAAEVWGADVDAAHIEWAKANLSPPFHFVTSTAYPHLPFEDATFGHVFGISVFTHLYRLLDAWIMEIRRILAPGGCALFTIHDEHTWEWLRKHLAQLPFWQQFVTEEELSRGLQHDLYVVKVGGGWGQTQVFSRTDWIRQEWGRYFEVVAIDPMFEGYQSLVVLRKPVPRR